MLKRKIIMNIYIFIKKIFLYALKKDVGRHAQSLSFATILSLVPITTIFLGIFASSKWTSIAKNNLESLFTHNFFPRAINDTFSKYINTFSHQASEIKHIGLIFFIVTIVLLFKDMESSFTAITNSTAPKKWYLRLLALFLLFFVPLFIFIILGLGEWLSSMSIFHLQNLLTIITNHQILIKTALFIFLNIWFLFLYKVLPHKNITIKGLLLGSFCATVAFTVSQSLFSWYLDIFSTYQIIYGVFSAIPIFLLWIYLNWQITLYGLLIANGFDHYKEITA